VCVVVVDIIIILLSLSLSLRVSPDTLSKKRKEGAGYDERKHLGDKIFPRRENFSFLGFQNFFFRFLSFNSTYTKEKKSERDKIFDEMMTMMMSATTTARTLLPRSKGGERRRRERRKGTTTTIGFSSSFLSSSSSSERRRRKTKMMSQNWDARDFDERRSSNSASGTSSNTNNNNDQKFIPLEAETEKQFREQSLNRLKQFIDETASDPEKAMKDPKTVGQKVLNLIIETCEIWNPPKFLWRTAATLLLAGNVCYRLLLKPSVKLKKRINMKQTVEQIARIGPETLGVAMMTSSFVGLVFTIQFCKEFSKVGLKNVIGGLLGLAFARELTPVICAIVLAGRVGSAIAAELGTMQVTEQVDQLTVLDTDPVDYLVIPRVLACMISLPILSLISFAQSMAASIILADFRYGVSPNVVIDSAAKYLELSDIGVMSAKSVAFGAVIAVISCGWGTTTIGGAKGVGESTTASVVISLVAIFVVDFVLSMVFFNK
jgi:ABC transport permease subunit